MERLSAADLVKEIGRLDTDRVYEYPSGRGSLRITEIRLPEGPISFTRMDVKGKASTGGISTSQLTRAALAFSNRPNYPIHFDRLFSAGGNSRSALEALLAYTPHFFICFPARTDTYTGEVQRDQKHIMWCPDDNHSRGEIGYKDYNEVITEFELGVDFGTIGITPEMLGDEFDSIEAKTTHTQMQIALIEIGNALNFQTWIAKNDHHIQVKDVKQGTQSRLGNLKGVIQSLNDVPIFYKDEIREAAALIDCIWFADKGDRIPAVIEVEHSTGVTSGLTRMLKLRDTAPSISTAFTIVAPNDLRNKVVTESNQGVFRVLSARYMPYSTVRELYGLIQRYSLSDVVDHTFVYPFMENIVRD